MDLVPLACENALCVSIEFPRKFDRVKSGWSIVYNDESQVTISQKYCISLKSEFVSVNSADPDEIQHKQHLFLVFAVLPKYPFRGFVPVRAKCHC